VEAPTAGSVIPRRRAAEDGDVRPAAVLPAALSDRGNRKPRLSSVLALIGIVYGALVAMVQPDLKKLVAYSS